MEDEKFEISFSYKIQDRETFWAEDSYKLDLDCLRAMRLGHLVDAIFGNPRGLPYSGLQNGLRNEFECRGEGRNGERLIVQRALLWGVLRDRWPARSSAVRAGRWAA